MPNSYPNILDYFLGNGDQDASATDNSQGASAAPLSILDHIVNGTSPLTTPLPMPQLPPITTPFPPNITNGMSLLPVPVNSSASTALSGRANALPNGFTDTLAAQNQLPTVNSNAVGAVNPALLASNVIAGPPASANGPQIPASVSALNGGVPQLPTAAQAVMQAAPNATGNYDPSTGTYLPGNVSVRQNMQMAAQHSGDMEWFKKMVQGGGPWDYHGNLGPQYENAGNFNYGATGAAMGFSPDVLDRFAGAYHVLRNGYDPTQGNPLGAAPYGDNKQDLREVNRGIAYAKKSSP